VVCVNKFGWTVGCVPPGTTKRMSTHTSTQSHHCVHAYIHTPAHAHTYHACMHTHAHTRTPCTRAHHACMHTDTRIPCMHAHSHTHVESKAQTPRRTHAMTDACTYAGRRMHALNMVNRTTRVHVHDYMCGMRAWMYVSSDGIGDVQDKAYMHALIESKTRRKAGERMWNALFQ
jgi:hypothetical protein